MTTADALKLDVTIGPVASVAFLADGEDQAPAKRKGFGRAVSAPPRGNRMKIVVREEATQKERPFTLRNSTVGILEGHQITVITAKPRRVKHPMLLALINRTTGHWEERPAAIQTAVRPRPYLTPPWKAAGLALLTAPLVWLYAEALMAGGPTGTAAVVFAGIFALLSYPLWWGGLEVWTGFANRRAVKRASRLIHEEIQRHVASAKAALAPEAPSHR